MIGFYMLPFVFGNLFSQGFGNSLDLLFRKPDPGCLKK